MLVGYRAAPHWRQSASRRAESLSRAVLQALDFGSGPSKECTPLLKVGDFDPNLCVRVINRQLNRDAGGAARLEFGDFVMISAITADNFVSRELVTFVILVALPACVEDAAHVTVGVSRQQETNA